MAQSKVLLDSNAYFRLARSIHPLLFMEFGHQRYCLYVINELDEEFERNPRLRSKFYWVRENKYVENRKFELTISRKEKNLIKQAYDFIKNHAIGEDYGTSSIDIRAVATAYVLSIPLVTDDSDMLLLAQDYNVETWKTLDLLKIMFDLGHIDFEKIREIASYLKYEEDLPKDFKRDYFRLFQEDPP